MEQHTRALLLRPAIFLVPALCYAQGYTITTVAGGVTPYYLAGTGDGSPATQAGLGSPAYDVAVDSPGNPSGAGNLYIVAGSLIRKVTPSGAISTIAGGGESVGDYVPATQAALAATAIAVDGTGNLYIADTAFGTSRLRKVNAAGIITTVAGGQPCCLLGDGGPATAAYISIPLGLAVDHSGNIYIAQSDNSNNYRIRRVSPPDLMGSRVIATVAGGGTDTGDGGPAASASLARPTGVAVDANGNIYIAEADANRIRKVSIGGIITTVATIHSPWHVTVDSARNLYVTQPFDAIAQLISPSGALTVIAGDGTHGYSGDGGLATGAEMDRPSGVVLGSQGAIYLSDATAGIARVRLLTPAPSLTITSTHTGYFLQGQTNATYTLTVSNTGPPATNAPVTVTETLPAGLSLVSMVGGSTSWSCTDNVCTNNDVLFGGSTYSTITVTVRVADNAPSSVTNMASAAGGGSATAYASDTTAIRSVCDINNYGTTTVADVQAMINQALGAASPANDLNHDGAVNVVDVQLVINSALSLGCVSS